VSAAAEAVDPIRPTGGVRAVGKGELFVSVKDAPYSAVGDGVADDTAAVQAWLNAGGTYLRDVTLRITSGLTMSGNNRRLFMDNAKILADGVNIAALTVTGDDCRIRAHIDGNNKANHGIKTTGARPVVEGCVIENIYSTTQTARAVEVTTNTHCTIRGNVIRNVVSVGDTVQGGANGAARAIAYIGSADASGRSVIARNIIDNVLGEEGDAIQVLFIGAGTSYPTANVTVRDNEIANVSRRFIKIQGSGCRVIGNILTHDGVVPTYPSNAIDIIQSDNVLVADNDIGPNPLVVQINVVGVSGDLTSNVVVRNNTIRQNNAKNAVSIFCNYVTESAIRGNTVHGGASAVSVGNSVNVAITNNIQHGGITTATSFSANATNTGVVMRNNLNMEAARATTATNSGTGALTEHNAKRP
jgi:hypothetical protein